MSNEARLASMLCARLCHDLSGPSGALAAAAGLARGADPDVQALLRDAAATLTARLGLLRAAWAPPSGPLDATGLERMAEGIPHAERTRVDVTGLNLPIPLEPGSGRVVLAILLLACEGLPRGGVIAFAGDSRAITCRIEGSRAAWPAALAAAIADAEPAPPDDQRELLAALTAAIAREAGARLSLSGSVLSAELPSP